MKRLLVLAAGPLQAPVIRRAREMGCYVIAADADPEAVGLCMADKAVVANIRSEEVMLHIAQEEQIDGIIHPCTEVAMNVMGRINDELHLSGIGLETALRTTNKYLMREAFRRGDAPSPQSLLCTDADHAWRIFHDILEGNAILKPTRNSGSRGVSKVDACMTREDFDSRYYKALTESRDNSVLIEHFIEGPEFSVEAIVWQGTPHMIAMTDKKTTLAPFFVELGHSQPSVYSDNVKQLLYDATEKGIRALGIDNCAVHSELKIHDGQAFIVEIGARLGGDFISTHLTPLSTGIDFVAAAISVCMGEEPDLRPRAAGQGVCIRYFTPKPGRLATIENAHLLNAPYVCNSAISCQVGDIIPEVRSSLDRSGHVIVTAPTPWVAIERAEKMIEEIQFITV